jgi:Xaa-Pro aminopeptidase
MSRAVSIAPPTADRTGRLWDRLTALELDAAVVSSAAHKRYFAGFILNPGEWHEFAGTLLLGPGLRRILVDSRFSEQASIEAIGWEVVEEIGPAEAILARQLRQLEARRVGLEAEVVSHAVWQALASELPGVDLVAIDAELRPMRIRKEPAELDAIGRACAIGDACFAHLLEVARPPMTERDVAWEMTRFFHDQGVDLAFEPIVLVGQRASMPHGQPSEAPLRSGAALLLDFGCTVDGYHSDMTRTIFIGRPNGETREAYAAVLGAQERTLAAIVDGATGRELDALAKSAVAEVGQEPFRHGLGHGIGLQVHEPPELRPKSDDVLGTGMVFSVEPGTYRPGKLGIRIEDIVHLGPNGPELLTKARRDLVVVE